MSLWEAAASTDAWAIAVACALVTTTAVFYVWWALRLESLK